MTTWGNICRICSSPADYEIFDKIPAYLHSSSNEFLHWQKPINALLEATTGLQVTRDDGLPHNICALCISYLKHAVSFREQAVSNAMSLTAVKMLQQKAQLSLADKESLLITSDSLNYAEDRQTDTNILLNNYAADQQDKVRKQLLSSNNFQPAAPPTQANVEQQMRYLNLLFDKHKNAKTGMHSNHRNTAVSGDYDTSSPQGEEPYNEEYFQAATSSDDNENEGAKKKKNIFSYKEKNFEEDDIMDMDELRKAISINTPKICKERKCGACFRRFMFEESYKEHMETCIEYKFLTYIEEINLYLSIRRKGAISSHEFIRRMIFCLRKTCDWLKDNCSDMLLPDLRHKSKEGGLITENATKQRRDSEGKSSSTSVEQNPNAAATATTLHKLHHKKKTTDLQRDFKSNERQQRLLQAAGTTKPNDFNLESNLGNLFKVPKTPQQQRNSGAATPITMSNNILYEIERSQSRNSSQPSDFEYVGSGGGVTGKRQTQLKKPIAVLGTAAAATTTTTINTTPNGNVSDQLTFLHKLQQATYSSTPTQQQKTIAAPDTPLIAELKELLQSAKSLNQLPLPLTPIKPSNLSFSARCNPCNILFETLASLEVHNAMNHNNSVQQQQQQQQLPLSIGDADFDADAEAERERIIALFEDDI